MVLESVMARTFAAAVMSAVFARFGFAVTAVDGESGDLAFSIVAGTFRAWRGFVAIADNLFKSVAAVVAFIVINRHNRLFQSYMN